MTAEERKQLKAEILDELLHFNDKGDKQHNPLIQIKRKWFASPNDKQNKPLMFELFGGRYGRVWDCVRKITGYILDSDYISRVADVEQAEKIADALCQTIYDLKVGVERSKDGETL